MTAEERATAGPAINGAREAVADAIAAKKSDLETAAINAQLATETLDMTLPPPPRAVGSIHPVRRCVPG